MVQNDVDELRQKYIKNPPEGMTPTLLINMTDFDLLDMHYFLTEDADLDDGEMEEGFYIDLFSLSSILSCSLSVGIFNIKAH